MKMEPKAMELLTGPNVGHLGYHGLDGYPRVLAVWFAFANDEVLVASPPDAYKCRALRADPRATLTVSTPETPYHMVSATGDVTIDVLEEPERIRFVTEIARRYLGPQGGDEYVQRWIGGGHPGRGDLLRLRVHRLRYTNVSGD